MIELLRAFLKTGTGSVIALLLGAVAVKIVALTLGESGVGLFSLLKQTHQIGIVVATLGGQVALIQGLAALEGERRESYFVWTFYIFLGATAVFLISFFIFSAPLSEQVFGSPDGAILTMVRWASLAILTGAAYLFFTGILNGHHAIGALAWIQVLVAVVTAAMMFPVVHWVQQGHSSAFAAALALPYGIGSLAAGILCWRRGWLGPLKKSPPRGEFLISLRHFFSVGGASLLSLLMNAVTILTVRSLIVQRQGMAGAGIYEAFWSLSMTYVTLILSSFTTYYLPKLSSLKNPEATAALMQKVFRLVLLILVPLIASMVMLKPFVVHLLYSRQFEPALPVMRWMLLGDYLKVSTWVLAMPMLAYADTKHFLASELIWNLGFLAAASVAVNHFGSLEGIGVGFFALYGISFLYAAYYAQRKKYFHFSQSVLVAWFLGFIWIALVSWQTWEDKQVYWRASALGLALSLLFSWFLLRREERAKMISFLR